MLSSCAHIEDLTFVTLHLPVLSGLTFRRWTRGVRYDKFGDFNIRTEIGNMIRDHWPKARLHLLDYAWMWSQHPMSRMPSVPWENVASISTCRKWGRSRPESLLQFAADSPKLQSLEINCMSQSFPSSGPKFPPVQRLSFNYCDWNYSAEEVQSIWDFSQLRSLSIVSGADWKFFPTLPRDALRNLTELKATRTHHDPTERGLTSELNHFISSAPGLTSIEITCSLEHLDINNLMKDWTQMRCLKIHDYTGFGPHADVCPTLSIADLINLQRCCPKLRELSLDLDTRTCDVSPHDPKSEPKTKSHTDQGILVHYMIQANKEKKKLAFIEIIASFKNLTTLTLHTETTQPDFVDYNEITIETGLDRPETPSLIGHVRRRKVGLPFELIVVTTGGHGVPVSSLTTEEWEA